MDYPNAFIGKNTRPSPGEIATALGSSVTAWSQFIDWMVNEQGVSTEEWQSSSIKHGWSLRLKVKGRTIVYLAPCNGCFRASFVLGSGAIEAARHSSLPQNVIQAIENAPRYAEGTGVQILIKGSRDLAPIRTLAQIKISNGSPVPDR